MNLMFPLYRLRNDISSYEFEFELFLFVTIFHCYTCLVSLLPSKWEDGDITGYLLLLVRYYLFIIARVVLSLSCIFGIIMSHLHAFS